MDGNTLAFIITLIKKYSSDSKANGNFTDVAGLSYDSEKLGGESSQNFFNKVTNNTDNIVEGGINKFVTRDEKESLKSFPNIINEIDNLGDCIEVLKKEINEIKSTNKDILDKLNKVGLDDKNINTKTEPN